MFRRKIAWLLIICMLLTQSGISIYADSLGNQNETETETTVESNEETVGAKLGEPEEETVESSEESVGAKLGEPEEETVESSEESVEANEESVGANACGARPEDEENSTGAKLGEPEEETVGSNEESVGEKLGEPEETTNSSPSNAINNKLNDSHRIEDDLNKWTNMSEVYIWYYAQTGDSFSDEGVWYPALTYYDLKDWYIDGKKTDRWWFPEDVNALGDDYASADDAYHEEKYSFMTVDTSKHFSEAPFTPWGDMNKTYTVYSNRLNRYMTFVGWTDDKEMTKPAAGVSTPKFYPGVQTTGILSDNYISTPRDDGKYVTKLYPVFSLSTTLPGQEDDSPKYQNKSVTIEFWQGYWSESDLYDRDRSRNGPTASCDYVKYVSQTGDTFNIYNYPETNSRIYSDQSLHFWSWSEDNWNRVKNNASAKERTHFQTIWSRVEDGRFSVTIPGGDKEGHYELRNRNRKLLGFNTTPRATDVKYELGKTYKNILDDAEYDYSGYNLKLWPVFESDSGGSEDNYEFRFSMDSRFASFKQDSSVWKFNANTKDEDFKIPTEDDIKYNGVTNHWESNWMLWGWSKVQHSYHLGETINREGSTVDGTIVSLDRVEELGNYDYYSNSSDNNVAEKFQNPLDKDKIIGEFKAFKDTLIKNNADVVFYPLFIKRPRLRMNIREEYEYQNDWFSDEPVNLATIKGVDKNYVEYKYGDPNTKLPEIDYDKNKYFISDSNWSNDIFALGDLNWPTNQKRLLPVVRRNDYIKQLIEMWKTETFSIDEYPINDQNNNIAWLAMDVDLLNVWNNYEGFRYGGEISHGSQTYSGLESYFTYYPVIVDRDKVIELQIDKNIGDIKNATIDPNIPWRPEITHIEYRKSNLNVTWPTEPNEGIYKLNEGDAGINTLEDMLFYLSTPSYVYNKDNKEDDESPERFKYLLFLEDDLDGSGLSPGFYGTRIVARDAKNQIAYEVKDITYDLADKKGLHNEDLKKDSLLNYVKNKELDNGILKVKAEWTKTQLYSYVRFYDIKNPDVLLTTVSSSELNRDLYFAATASVLIDRVKNKAIDFYKAKDVWITDQNNGVTDIELVNVEFDEPELTVKDGLIALVQPKVKVYLDKTSRAKLTFSIDETNVSSVTGKREFYDNETISSPSIVMKDEWTFEGWSIDGTNVVDDKTLSDFINNWKNSTDPNKGDKVITAIIKYTPYPTYTVKFKQIDNVIYGSNYNTYKTQTVKKYIGEGRKPEVSAAVGYVLERFDVVGNGVGSPSVAFPLTKFSSSNNFTIDDDMAAVASSDNILNFVPVLSYKYYTVEFRKDADDKVAFENADADGKVFINNVHIGEAITAPKMTVTSGYKVISSKAAYNNNAYTEKPFPKTLTEDVIRLNGADAYAVTTIVMIPVADVYSLRFEVDPNSKEKPTATGEMSYPASKDKSEVVPPDVKSGESKYVFDGWEDDTGKKVTEDEIKEKFDEWKNSNPEDDIVFYPSFRDSYTITFVLDSVAFDVDDTEKLVFYEVDVNDVDKPKYTVKDDYIAKDWVDDKGNVVDIDSAIADWQNSINNNTNPSNKVFTLQYEKAKTFTFVIDGKYGDVDSSAKLVFTSKDTTITAPTVTAKTGYKNAGWASKQNAKPTEVYTDINNEIDKWKNNPTSDMTVYFIFDEDDSIFKIKFEVDETKGEYFGSNQFFVDVTEFDNEKSNITVNPKTDYMFTGWVNSSDSSEKYMRAEDITWAGTETVVYVATFKKIETVNPKPNPTPKPNPAPNKPGKGDDSDGGGGDSSGGGQAPSGYTPPNNSNPKNPVNPQNPQNPNNPNEMTPEEKKKNPPEEKYIIVNMDKHRDSSDSSSQNANNKSSDGGQEQNYLWETTDRVEWRLINMDNIIENVDYTKTPEWDVVKSFFTQNCKFYEDGWCFLQYRGTNEWYHFAPNNIMDTGWFSKNGNLYYLQTDYNTTFGSMYTGVRDIDGIRYVFGKDGKLQGVLGFTALLDSQTTTK